MEATALNREIVAIEPLSKYSKRSSVGLPSRRWRDLLGGEACSLDGDLGDPGEVVERHHVADDVDLGVAGEGEVGQD